MSRAFALCLVLGGCEVVGPLLEDTDAATGAGMLTTTTVADSSNASGRLVVNVEVDGDMTAFLVTAVAEADTNRLALEAITDPDGELALYGDEWLFGVQTLTASVYAQGPVVAAQWPIRQEDGPLVPGTWKVEFSSTSDNAPIDVTTMTKADPDWQSGVVDAQIVWCEGIDQDPAVVEAVAVAVERWRAIWADQGITLRETYRTSNIDPDLSFGTEGSLGILTAAEDATGHSLQVIIGELVAGNRGLFGVAAGIPGSVVPTEQTFVLVSWLVHAGFDGEFSSYEEKRILGETLAHETGHFMGLPHPVEVGWSFYDALEDTEQCVSVSSCQNDLGDNLMFPYPVCTGYGEDCVQQGGISQDQKRVLQQYLATL